ncbi:MAG: hypothetical protein AB8F78_04745 [Saprospiraceae bacterium]
MKRFLFSALAFLAASTLALASPGPQPKNKTLPKVFVLGQFESSYDDLVTAYDQSLLTACNCTMKSAFGKWLGMLHELELYSTKQDVDIRGVKVWLHVFWNADGSIDHVAYHLRPNSKVIDDKVMSDLLAGFAKQYSFPLTTESGYAHYSTGSFPVFGEVVED